MSRPLARELALSFAFTLLLIGVAEMLVRTADWPRLSALIVVLLSGHALKALVTWLVTRQSSSDVGARAAGDRGAR